MADAEARERALLLANARTYASGRVGTGPSLVRVLARDLAACEARVAALVGELERERSVWQRQSVLIGEISERLREKDARVAALEQRAEEAERALRDSIGFWIARPEELLDAQVPVPDREKIARILAVLSARPAEETAG